MEFFYKKEIDLDKENNFNIDLLKSNTVEGQKFTSGEEYVISVLELKPTEVDFTLWQAFDKIKIYRTG